MDQIVKVPDGYYAPFFYWDEQNKSSKLQIQENNFTIKVIDGNGFKTVIGNQEFEPGRKYYFEVLIDKGQLIKIGVCRKDINIEEAFSDTIKGWAFYNGELRHASNSTGKKYGTVIKTGDTIGVLLDMIDGSLSFSKNGEIWEVAFKSQELCTGILYPACAPIYLNDQFTLKMMIRED